MRLTVGEALKELNVELDDRSLGKWHKCRCPMSACEGKPKHNFGVRIYANRIGYNCFRCAAKGCVWLGGRQSAQVAAQPLSCNSAVRP